MQWQRWTELTLIHILTFCTPCRFVSLCVRACLRAYRRASFFVRSSHFSFLFSSQVLRALLYLWSLLCRVCLCVCGGMCMCIHTCARVCVRVGYSCSPVATPTPNECIDVSFAADVYVYVHAHTSVILICATVKTRKKKRIKAKADAKQGRSRHCRADALSLSLSRSLLSSCLLSLFGSSSTYSFNCSSHDSNHCCTVVIDPWRTKAADG